MFGEPKGELERVKVDEHRDERPEYVLGYQEEQGRALYRVRSPSYVEAPDILRQVRVGRKRLAAAQSGGGHGGHRLCALERSGRRARQDFVDDDGGVEEALRAGAPPVRDEGDAGEGVLREVIKYSIE